jgi:hypothetical protein
MFNVGDIVRLVNDEYETLGRVCKVNDVTCCVQFSENMCLRIGKSALVHAEGDAPQCSEACARGCA